MLDIVACIIFHTDFTWMSPLLTEIFSVVIILMYSDDGKSPCY